MEGDDPDEQKRSRQLQADCRELRVIETAIAVESSYCEGIGGSNSVDTSVNNIMARVAVEYEQPGLCFTAAISYFEKYCNPNTDPYKPGKCECESVNFLISFKQRTTSKRERLFRRCS
jgi:hypothetical protein